jgi:Tol biopolymer transport system component/DNA-binding winged helix-turn-helix (wHTH) protein
MPLTSNSFRFGPFVLDIRAAELRTSGTKIKLPEQPFQVLTALLEHAGEVVTREELRQRLWPVDTFVDFEHSLNAAVKRLREVLGDSAESPRFIETLPRHGYRFIAPVETPNSQPTEVAKLEHLIQRFTRQKNWLALTSALLIALLGIGFWRFSRGHPLTPLISGEAAPVAVYHGDAGEPALSPDGERIAFVAGEGSDWGMYTAQVGGEKAVRLTNNPGDHFPTWSPDSRQIAFNRYSQEGLGIYTVPALGGTEHRVYLGPAKAWVEAGVAWSPDGETITFSEHNKDKIHARISLLSLADFKTTPLTSPDDDHEDGFPSYSPDGSVIAFLRGNVSGTTADFFVVPAKGGIPKQITSDFRNRIGAAAWTPDGKEIVFSSWSRGGFWGLWRMPASGGTPRPIAGVGSGAFNPSIGRANRLVYQEMVSKESIYRLDLADEKHRLGAAAVAISERGGKMRPHFSPDGRKIAFESDRLGSWEIWTCDVNGLNCAQLTSLDRVAGAPQWSPDAHNIAFEFHPQDRSEIYLVDVRSGQASQLSTNPGSDNLAPSWSRDGEWLYFGSSRAARPFRFQLWKVRVKGGPPVQVTKNGGLRAIESPDGHSLYFTKYDVPGIWNMPIHGGPESLVEEDFDSLRWYNWAVCEKGIYLISCRTKLKGGEVTRAEGNCGIDFLEFSTHKLIRLWDLEKPPGWGLTLSPDRHSLMFVQRDFRESNLMMVDNFR